MKIKYLDIKREIKKLGLTPPQVADMLEISVQQLYYLIREDKPRIHWIMFGIANYYSDMELNLIKELNNDL